MSLKLTVIAGVEDSVENPLAMHTKIELSINPAPGDWPVEIEAAMANLAMMLDSAKVELHDKLQQWLQAQIRAEGRTPPPD